MTIKIHYRDQYVKSLYENAGVQTEGAAGFDLVCVEDLQFDTNGQFKLLDLGVVVKPPKGHHCLLMPRSSTYKKFGLIQANSIGLIDEDYCGPDDFWRFPAIYLGSEPIEIKAGARIAQFILQRTIPVTGVEGFQPAGDSRGGFGSTGHFQKR